MYVMAVGDDDQNIYTFRGTSVKWIRQFQVDFGTDASMEIPDNFRSTPGIIEVSARFISRNESRLKPKNWVQRIPNACRAKVAQNVKRDWDSGKVVRLRVQDKAHARVAIAVEVENIRKAFPDVKLGDICVAHRTNAAAHLTKLLLDGRGLPSRVIGEHRFAPHFNIGVVELIQQLNVFDIDETNISYAELEARLDTIFRERNIHPSWREPWDSFFNPELIDISTTVAIPLKQMLWRIDEHFMGRSGAAVPPDRIANLTLHRTKGLEFHTVFLFPPDVGPDTEPDGLDGLRRLYFVGLSRAKVKAYLIDWSGCNSNLWDEITQGAGKWLTEREPVGEVDEPTAEECELAEDFRYFDSFKTGLGTGMNIYFVANQNTIKSLTDGQELEVKPGKTKSGKPKLELWRDWRCVGMIKSDAIRKLHEKVDGDWDRIFRVETAQVILTDTPEEHLAYNKGQDWHYYVVPRIFYKRRR